MMPDIFTEQSVMFISVMLCGVSTISPLLLFPFWQFVDLGIDQPH